MEEEPPPPPPPRPLPPRTGPRCGPWQRRLDEIPIIRFDVNGSYEDYAAFIELKLKRAGRIAPLKHYGAPVTPRKNPMAMEKKNGKEIPESGVCYHIIELFNSAEKEDLTLLVQLLVSDYDGYMPAFRRRVRNVWGTWNRFINLYVPSWLGSVQINVLGSHDKQTILGGTTLLENMFYSLARPNRSNEDIRQAILLAIVIFCEAYRLVCIFRIVVRAIRANQATPLETHHWERINSWGHLCKYILQRARYGQVLENADAVQRVMQKCNYANFDEIIGDNGDLTLLMRDEEALLDADLKQWLKRKRAGADINNPSFRDEEEDA